MKYDSLDGVVFRSKSTDVFDLNGLSDPVRLVPLKEVHVKRIENILGL